jgi:hypothetical protein
MTAVLDAVQNADRAARRVLHGASRPAISRWQGAMARLDAVLVAPLDLPGGVSIELVAGAELAGVTWNVLPGLAGVGVRWAEQFQLSAAPRFDARTAVALFGGPDLRHGADELDALEQRWATVTRVDGDAATGAELVRALATADIVHLGAHGTLRREAPLFSHLALADGPLTLGEVVRVPRLPTCLVLSACHLGPTTVVQGSPWPVAMALAGRGCRSLIVSSLPVGDRSTVPFMAALHGGLAGGLTTTDALAAAHADALRRDDHGCVGVVEVAIRG